MGQNQEISNKDIYDLLKGVITKTDEIKEEIRLVKSELTKELDYVKCKNEELKNENESLRNRLYDCERKLKKYNAVIYGIKEAVHGEVDETQQLLKIINDKLEINCRYTDIRDVHRIGRKSEGKVRPIYVEFINYKLKIEVLTNAKKLKGTKIFITNDYIPEDYKKQKVLYEHLRKARGNNHIAYIKNNTLIVNEELFTYEDLIQEASITTETIKKIDSEKQTTNRELSTGTKNRTEEKEISNNSNTNISGSKLDERKRKQSVEENENPTKRSTRLKTSNIKYFN